MSQLFRPESMDVACGGHRAQSVGAMIQVQSIGWPLLAQMIVGCIGGDGSPLCTPSLSTASTFPGASPCTACTPLRRKPETSQLVLNRQRNSRLPASCIWHNATYLQELIVNLERPALGASRTCIWVYCCARQRFRNRSRRDRSEMV